MSPTLDIRGLHAGHGRVTVVRDFGLTAKKGTVTALLGPNGAGKTTLLETIAGLLPRHGGHIDINGTPLRSGHPAEANHNGVVLVPDDRALFTDLTVIENLAIARRRNGPTIDEMIEVFPSLHPRRKLPAGTLSGGEQQMLALGRALIQQPSLLLIDEMSMGLAPVIVENLLPTVRQVADTIGATIILVEQHVQLALDIADDALILVHGETTHHGDATQLANSPETIQNAYLGAG